jgi:hypothetical protein
MMVLIGILSGHKSAFSGEVLFRWIKHPDRGRITEHGSCRSKNLIKAVALSS